MTSVSDKIIHLRQLMAEQCKGFSLPEQKTYPTGLSALDEIGLPRGAVTEIVTSGPSTPGATLLFYATLHALLQKGESVILVDGKDAFVPNGVSPSGLRHLLWVRCHQAWEALKAADLAVRDGNIPLVILFLSLNPPGELRKIPATSWHRLQLLAEKSAATVLVFSPQAQVGCAKLRLSVEGAFPLKKLHVDRDGLLPALSLQVARRRIGQERSTDEAIRRVACA